MDRNVESKTNTYKDIKRALTRLFTDGQWDSNAVESFRTVLTNRVNGRGPNENIAEIITGLEKDAFKIGSPTYMTMFMGSVANAKGKADLPLKQLGAYVDEEGVLQLSPDTPFSFCEEMAPDDEFLAEYSAAVHEGYPKGLARSVAADDDELDDMTKIHQFRMYLDRQNIHYIRQHFDGDTDIAKLMAYDKALEAAGKECLYFGEPSRYHNKLFLGEAFQHQVNDKIETANHHSEFIVDLQTGSFVSQWDVLEQIDGKVCVPKDLSPEQQRKLLNGESFNYGADKDAHHRLDVAPASAAADLSLDYYYKQARKSSSDWKEIAKADYDETINADNYAGDALGAVTASQDESGQQDLPEADQFEQATEAPVESEMPIEPVQEPAPVESEMPLEPDQEPAPVESEMPLEPDQEPAPVELETLIEPVQEPAPVESEMPIEPVQEPAPLQDSLFEQSTPETKPADAFSFTPASTEGSAAIDEPLGFSAETEPTTEAPAVFDDYKVDAPNIAAPIFNESSADEVPAETSALNEFFTEATPAETPVLDEASTDAAPAEAPAPGDTFTDAAFTEAPAFGDTSADVAFAEAPAFGDTSADAAPAEAPTFGDTSADAAPAEAPTFGDIPADAAFTEAPAFSDTPADAAFTEAPAVDEPFANAAPAKAQSQNANLFNNPETSLAEDPVVDDWIFDASAFEEPKKESLQADTPTENTPAPDFDLPQKDMPKEASTAFFSNLFSEKADNTIEMPVPEAPAFETAAIGDAAYEAPLGEVPVFDPADIGAAIDEATVDEAPVFDPAGIGAAIDEAPDDEAPAFDSAAIGATIDETPVDEAPAVEAVAPGVAITDEATTTKKVNDFDTSFFDKKSTPAVDETAATKTEVYDPAVPQEAPAEAPGMLIKQLAVVGTVAAALIGVVTAKGMVEDEPEKKNSIANIKKNKMTIKAADYMKRQKVAAKQEVIEAKQDRKAIENGDAGLGAGAKRKSLKDARKREKKAKKELRTITKDERAATKMAKEIKWNRRKEDLVDLKNELNALKDLISEMKESKPNEE